VVRLDIIRETRFEQDGAIIASKLINPFFKLAQAAVTVSFGALKPAIDRQV
jgi:hypothetical protein